MLVRKNGGAKVGGAMDMLQELYQINDGRLDLPLICELGLRGGGYLFVACRSRIVIDHASLAIRRDRGVTGGGGNGGELTGDTARREVVIHSFNCIHQGAYGGSAVGIRRLVGRER